MATIKKMARVVILKRMNVDHKNLPIFDAVVALADADLTVEYNAIVAERQAEVAIRRASLTARSAEEAATIDNMEQELL